MGFIIGVIGSWAENLKDQIIGYYDTLELAKVAAESLYNKTIRYEQNRKVYIVELENNKSYKVSDLNIPWYKKYPHYIVDNRGIVEQQLFKFK